MLNLFNVECFTAVVIWMVTVLSNASESVITGELKWTCVSVPSQRCVWWGRGGRVVQRAAGSQRGSGVCWLTLERNLTNTHTHTHDWLSDTLNACGESVWTDYQWWEVLASPDGREECVSVAPCLCDDPSSSDAPADHTSRVTQPWGTTSFIISSAVFSTVRLYQHHQTVVWNHKTVVNTVKHAPKYPLS